MNVETNNPRPIEEVIEEHILEDKLVVLEEADRKYSHGYKIHINTITIINAVTAELRRRGWLDPDEVSRLRDEHDKLAKNFSANAKLLDEALAKIAILTAVGVVTKSAKVETLPREVTWREVVEAVQAAGAEFAYEIGCDGWKCRVETIPCDSIDEALERLRDMAETETKPEPVTPDTIWENEIYGFGYEELPEWVRDAIKAEAERINEKEDERCSTKP